VQLPQTVVEWLGSFIVSVCSAAFVRFSAPDGFVFPLQWGGKGLAPETEGAAK
jgi:hypothetical protein